MHKTKSRLHGMINEDARPRCPQAQLSPKGVKMNVHELRLLVGLGCVVTLVGWSAPETVQAQARPETAAAPARARTDDQQALTAKVERVEGTVRHAPGGTRVTDVGAWKQAKRGDELGAGTQIRTSLRSLALLRFGDDTIVMVKSMTLASIDEFYRTAVTKTTRLGLGYGTVRCGVSEGELRSDFTIDTPVATLSKRGTWDFQAAYYRDGSWRFSGPVVGLTEALYKLTGQRRLLHTGQYVNNLNIGMTWIRQARFDRSFSLHQLSGLTASEKPFMLLQAGGQGVAAPDGQQITAFTKRAPANALRQRGAVTPPILPRPTFFDRPEGDFGTFSRTRQGGAAKGR